MKKTMISKIAAVAMAATMVMGQTVFAAESTGADKLTVSENFNVTFNQPNSIKLTLSTDTVDFGDVNGLTASTVDAGLTATVESSLPYDVTIKANDDFIGNTDTNKIPINKLNYKLSDSEDYTNVAAKDTDYALWSGEATLGTPTAKSIDFKLDSTIGYAADTYTAPMTITATQK